jgi:hypothetical protein
MMQPNIARSFSEAAGAHPLESRTELRDGAQLQFSDFRGAATSAEL